MEEIIVNYLLPIIGSFLSFLALMLTRKVLTWLNVKLGIATSDKLQRDVESAVKDAVWSAEEKAAVALKQGLPSWTSDMKYKWAIEIVGKAFPKLTRDEADLKINAMLGKTTGLGASEELGECQVQSQPKIVEDIKLDPIVEKELQKP